MPSIIDLILNTIRPPPKVQPAPPDLSKVKIQTGALNHKLVPAEPTEVVHSAAQAIPVTASRNGESAVSSVTSSTAALVPASFSARRSSVLSSLMGDGPMTKGNEAFASESFLNDAVVGSVPQEPLKRDSNSRLNLSGKLRRPSVGAIQQALELT